MRSVVSFLALFVASTGMADAVDLRGQAVQSTRRGQLELTSQGSRVSASGVTLEIGFDRVESASPGAASGSSARGLMIKAVRGAAQFADIIVRVSTTCVRTAPVRGVPFVNQVLPDFRLQVSAHSVPTAFIPATIPIVLRKSVHGGETHHCEADLKFFVFGQPQIDPMNGTDTFHPQFQQF
jgi:hypothetical protein